MAKNKKLGCGGGLCLIGLAVLVGYFIDNQIGALCGGFIGLVFVIFISREPKERICDICGSPVIHTSYKGEINGERYNVICAKCKNHITGKRRKEKMSEILK